MKTKVTLGEKLKQARQAAGLTQYDLADRLGVTQATVSRMERGDSDILMSTLARIARILEVDLFVEFRPRQKPVAASVPANVSEVTNAS